MILFNNVRIQFLERYVAKIAILCTDSTNSRAMILSGIFFEICFQFK